MKFLFEGIKDAYRYFQDKYPEDIFYKIISLDPTAKVDKDKKGNYFDWLLKNVFHPEDAEEKLNDAQFVEDVTKYLTAFEDNKKYLDNKNITQFKDFDELKEFIDGFHHELSYSEQEAENQKLGKNAQINKDYKIIYESEHFVLIEILTYAGSIKVGRGTHWCTASTTPANPDNYFTGGKEHYDDYTHAGSKLYVIMNKEDKSEKYQFVDNGVTRQFLNSDDAELTLDQWEHIRQDEDLIDYIATNISSYIAYMYDQTELDIFDEEILDDTLPEYLAKQPHSKTITFYDFEKIYSNAFDNESLGIGTIYTNVKEIVFDSEPIESIPSYTFNDLHIKMNVPDATLINSYAFNNCDNLLLKQSDTCVLSRSSFIECHFKGIQIDSRIRSQESSFVRCHTEYLEISAKGLRQNKDALVSLIIDKTIYRDKQNKNSFEDYINQADEDLLIGLGILLRRSELFLLDDYVAIDKEKYLAIINNRLGNK